MELIFLKDLAVAGVLIYILYQLLEFEEVWHHDTATAARLMELNSRQSVFGFFILVVASFISVLGTFFLAFQDYENMSLMFDFSLVFWALFFKIMNDTVRNRKIL